MRKWAATIVAAGILVTAPVPIGARAPRKAGLAYQIDDDNQHVAGPNFHAGSWEESQAYAFQLKKGERSVSISISDEREGPVSAYVVQYVWTSQAGGAAKTGEAVTRERICGATEKPIELLPKIQVEVQLHKGTCEDGTPSTPTNGHIYAKFYKKR